VFKPWRPVLVIVTVDFYLHIFEIQQIKDKVRGRHGGGDDDDREIRKGSQGEDCEGE
jgi:hypothetical protein